MFKQLVILLIATRNLFGNHFVYQIIMYHCVYQIIVYIISRLMSSWAWALRKYTHLRAVLVWPAECLITGDFVYLSNFKKKLFFLDSKFFDSYRTTRFLQVDIWLSGREKGYGEFKAFLLSTGTQPRNFQGRLSFLKWEHFDKHFLCNTLKKDHRETFWSFFSVDFYKTAFQMRHLAHRYKKETFPKIRAHFSNFQKRSGEALPRSSCPPTTSVPTLWKEISPTKIQLTFGQITLT